MILLPVEKVPFFTPVESEEKPFLPVLKVFDRYLCFGDEVAIQIQGQAPIEGSRVCRKELRKTNCIATALKIATYILSLGIFPLIALMVKAIARCVYSFHYAAALAQEEELAAPRPLEQIIRENAVRVDRDPMPPRLAPMAPAPKAEPLSSPRKIPSLTPIALTDIAGPLPPEPVNPIYPQVHPRIEPTMIDSKEPAQKIGEGGKSTITIAPAPQPSLTPEEAALYFQNRSLFDLEEAVQNRRVEVDGCSIGLSEEAIQAVKKLLPEKSIDYYKDKDFSKVEEAFGLAKSTSGKWIHLSNESSEAVKEMYRKKVKLEYQHFDLEMLKNALTRERIPIRGGKDLFLTPELAEVFKEMVAEKMGQTKEANTPIPRETDSDSDDEIEPEPKAMLVPQDAAKEATTSIVPEPEIDSEDELEAEPKAMLAPQDKAGKSSTFPSCKTPENIKLYFQNQPLHAIEKAVISGNAQLSSGPVELDAESVQAVRELLPEKIKLAFQNASFPALSTALFYRQTEPCLGSESIQVLKELIREKTRNQFGDFPLWKLQTLEKWGKTTIETRRVNLSEDSILGVKELIRERARAEFQSFKIPALENLARNRKSALEEDAPIDATTNAIVELIREKVRAVFGDYEVGPLETILPMRKAFVAGDWINLGSESIRVLQELIAEKRALSST